jgi:hypothetical protein
MFSLGLIIYQILKDHLGDNKTHLFMKLSNNSINSYKTFFNSYDSYLSSKLKFENDDNFLLSKLLQKEQSARPRVREIIDTPWFNDPKLKALNFIMNLESNDQKKNIEFLQKLPKIIGMFENKIIIKRFLPALLKAIKVETLINPCLPAIFSICESPTLNISFGKDIWPKLRDLFKLRSLPAAAIYFLISKVQFIGEHISQTDFSQYFLNLICKAMDCNVPKIQFVVSNNMKFIAKNIDSLSFKNQIFPRMMQVVSTTNSKTLKIDMLNNIKTLYTKLDQNLINDRLLVTLEKVRKVDNNNDVCMCICDIYLEIAKIVNLEGIANKILPNLISMLVTANITKSNFDKIMNLITTYLDQIKKNRYNELINDGSTLNVDSLANNKSNDFQLNSTKEDDNFMDSLLASSKPITNTNTNSKGSEELLNNLLGSNSLNTFNNNPTNNNSFTSNNNNSFNNSFTSNNKNNDFSFVGSNNNNNNSNNNSSQFDFNFGNNSTKKNDIFAGVSNNNNYNMPSNNNNDLFNNMNVNKTNNSSNKGDLLNNLMKDLPSSNNMNNSFGNNSFGNNTFGGGNNNNFGNNFNSGNNSNGFFNMNLGNNNKSNNPFDYLDNNQNNNKDNSSTGIGNTINFDFGLNTNKNKQSTNNNFMNLNSNQNSNNNNSFGGMNFGFNNNNMNNNNNNNNSNDLFNFVGNNNQTNNIDSCGFSFI